MGGHRRARSIALVCALAAASGCLDSPPPAGDGDGGADGDGDGGGGDSDGGLGDEPDAGSCPAIVTNAFDSDDWVQIDPPGAFVERTPSWTRVRATPSKEIFAYGDLHTQMLAPLTGSTLTVEVGGPIVSVLGEVGIAWQTEAGDQSYELEVANGLLRAIHRTASSEVVVCSSPCPDYSMIAHTRLRLREQGGTVNYQSASEAGEWVDIGNASTADLPHNVYLYASATGPGSGDLTVVAAEWRACQE